MCEVQYGTIIRSNPGSGRMTALGAAAPLLDVGSFCRPSAVFMVLASRRSPVRLIASTG